MIELHLPYPPTVGNYWGQRGKRRFIRGDGINFRCNVYSSWVLAGQPRAEGRLKIRIALYPPDKRRRDIDNTLKATLDALEHAGVFNDDEQVDDLQIVRCEIVEGGACTVMIEELCTGEGNSV